MRRAFEAAVVLVAAAALSCHKPAPPPAEAGAPSTDQILASTLPGVVLLVNRHEGGAIGFGAGIVLDDDGLVLTNLHVVSGGSLGAMAYDRKRVSYIPQEGGLARYLFENDALVMPARLVRGEPGLDLALVHVNLPTKGLKLPLREEAVKQGERVMAVGHPGETVWSFTTGVVSSLHQDMIQTDAAINRGNSGGPLIDATGKVVGINTSKLVGDMHGIGFARPVALARALIAGQATKSVIDRSTPELAVKTCARGYELASEEALDCIDEDAWFEWQQDKLRRKIVKMKLNGAGKADFEKRVFSVPKEKLVAVRRESQLARMRGEDPYAAGRALDQEISALPGVDGSAASYRKTFRRAPTAAKLREQLDLHASDAGIGMDVDAYMTEVNARIFARTGMKLDPTNTRADIELTKMGIRIERSREIDPTHAWVAIAGRNLDASEYRTSVFLVKKPDGWRRVEHPLTAEEKTRPADFPPAATDYASDLDLKVKYEAEGFHPQTWKLTK